MNELNEELQRDQLKFAEGALQLQRVQVELANWAAQLQEQAETHAARESPSLVTGSTE